MTKEETISTSKEIEDLLIKSNFSLDNLKYLAREVSANSHSPYSNFPVGAVVAGIPKENNIRIFPGTNIEPTVQLSICAERAAIFNGIASGCKKFIALAISTPKSLEATPEHLRESQINKFTPCGACREIILKTLEAKGIVIIDGLQRTFTAKELLPHPILDANKLKTLTIEEMEAVDGARIALHNSHTPYSKNKCGVGILLEENSKIFTAGSLDSNSFSCSVEPLKAAFGSYIAQGGIKNKIKAVVFAFPFVQYPPGDTLQLIADHTEPHTKIIIDNMGVITIEELLPFPFKL